MFHSRRHNTLSPSWHYRTSGFIWQLMADTAGRIAGEERDVEQRRVRFFCLETATGKVLWEKLAFEESWWQGMEALGEGVLLLHGFANPDMPGHRGIIAVDLDTGTLLWKSGVLKFLRLEGGMLSALGEGVDGETVVRLEVRTGNPSVSGEPPPRRVPARDASLRGGEVPADEETRSALLRYVPSTAPAGRADCLRAGSALVLSYWDPGDDRSSERGTVTLKVVDTAADSVVYQDIVLRHTPPPVTGAFFMLHDHLYYVRERTTLVAVRVALPER